MLALFSTLYCSMYASNCAVFLRLPKSILLIPLFGIGLFNDTFWIRVRNSVCNKKTSLHRFTLLLLTQMWSGEKSFIYRGLYHSQTTLNCINMCPYKKKRLEYKRWFTDFDTLLEKSIYHINKALMCTLWLNLLPLSKDHHHFWNNSEILLLECF